MPKPPKAKSRPKPAAPPAPLPPTYLNLSQQPLQALFFLLPLIVLYELGTLHMAATGDGQHVAVIRAYGLLKKFFEDFDITWYYTPGLIVVAVLFCWHLAKRDPWRFDPGLYARMWGESLLWALPMLVWGLVFFRAPGPAPAMSATAPDQSVFGQITLSVGAGIYEELLFRLIAIALLHMLFSDLLALPPTLSASAAIIISALAFAYYHFPEVNPMGWSIDQWNKFFFITCAGIYLAIIYVLRGFGIVAGAHALYDIILAILLIRAR